jgi:pimeloyl-ACP methyl ester carboxylesterase
MAFAALPGLAHAAAPEAIHVRVAGAGPRTWLLIHPFGASGRFWEARAAALAAEHGVTVLSPDLPSHGRSALQARFGYPEAAVAVGQALRAWPEPELVVGASSGGLVGLHLAAGLAAAVVAVGVGDAFTPENLQALQRQARGEDAGSAQFMAAFLEQGEPQRAALARHAGDLAAFGGGPLVDEATADSLAGRTMILNGLQDSFFRPEAAQRLAERIPRASLTLLNGAGHLEPLGAPWRARTWAAIEVFRRSL